MKCSDDQSDFLGQFLTRLDNEQIEYRYEISHLKERACSFLPNIFSHIEEIIECKNLLEESEKDVELMAEIESILAETGHSTESLIFLYKFCLYYACIVKLSIGIIEYGCHTNNEGILSNWFSLNDNDGQLNDNDIFETLMLLPPYIAKSIIKKCCPANLADILLTAYKNQDKGTFSSVDIKYDISHLSRACYSCSIRMLALRTPYCDIRKLEDCENFNEFSDTVINYIVKVINILYEEDPIDAKELRFDMASCIKYFRACRNQYFYFLRLIRDGSFDEFTRKCLTEILMENEDYEYMQDLLARFERREQHKNMEYESDPLHFSIAPDKSKEEREEICKELHNKLVSEKLVSYSTTLDQVRFVFGLLGDCRPQGYKAITWIKKSTHGQSVPVLVKLLHEMGVLPNICCQEDIDKLRNCFDLRKPLEVKRVNEYIKKDTYSPEVGKVHDIYKKT